jgi:hypothetical protein
LGSAVVTVTNTQINATGFRVGSLGDTTLETPTDVPNPGNGIEFEETSRGFVSGGTVTGSLNIGFVGNPRRVVRKGVVLFDNGKNFAPKD